MTVTFRQLVNAMKSREGMYVYPVDFYNIVSFLEGFSSGVKSVGIQSQLDGFQDWIERKVGHESSSHWSFIIKEEIADGDAEKAIECLYRCFDDFFDQDTA